MDVRRRRAFYVTAASFARRPGQTLTRKFITVRYTERTIAGRGWSSLRFGSSTSRHRSRTLTPFNTVAFNLPQSTLSSIACSLDGSANYHWESRNVAILERTSANFVLLCYVQ